MASDLSYEQSLSTFAKKRHDLLDLLTKVTPQATELHRRRWRNQQFDNSLHDIKQTVAACNMQLDDERSMLEDLNSETSRLRAMNTKLKEDVKILEGVTGMRANTPDEISDDVYDRISTLAVQFREDFASFYEELPVIKQELPLDPSLELNSRVLMDTLRECITLTFNTRAEAAFLSKESADKTSNMKKLERELKIKEMKLKSDVDNQMKRVEDSTRRMVKAIEEQGTDLRKEARRIEEEYVKEHFELKKSIEMLSSQERNLLFRCNNMKTYNDSLRENMKRRALELEIELDQFQRRIDVIRKNPNTVDRRLVNMSLLLTKKSTLLDQAIYQMRTEICDFDMWLSKINNTKPT